MDVPSPIDPEALLAETSMVRRLAQALVRRADLAHDVAQDVMLVALRQPHPPEHLRGWLAAVTRRLAGKTRRSQQVRARHEGDAAPPPANDAEQQTTARLQLHRRLTDAVLALPEPYRTTVTLRFFDDLPPRAIAQRVGASGEVVRKRLSRGLEMLRERLDDDFGDRAQWLRAFAVVGLLPVGSPWLLLTVLAMNKLAIAAAAVLAVGVYFLWPDSPPPPQAATVAAASVPAPAAGHLATDDVARDAVVIGERVTASVPATTTSPACVVHVVDERGRPLEDALVHCWARGSEQSVSRATDRDGRTTFDELAGPGGALVVADGRLPHHAPMGERSGDHRLVLRDGESISGTLSVDGQPGGGWRMALRGIEIDDAVPEPLREHYRWRGARSLCDRHGGFRFLGLPADWKGNLELPQPLWLADGSVAGDGGALALSAPQHQLDIRATQLPTIRGRVFWRDTKEPVESPMVMGNAEFADGQGSPLVSVEGNRDGTFAIGFYGSSSSRRATWRDPHRRPAMQRVRLTVEDRVGGAREQQELDAAGLTALGELVVYLDRSATTHFRCVDVQGRPIAGARVKARVASAPTDGDGRGTFAGVPGEVRFVGSPGHRTGPLAPREPAAGTAEDPLVFVLEPTNVLRIRAEGRDVAGLPCLVRSEVGMFAGGRGGDFFDADLQGQDLNHSASGRTMPDGSTQWNEFSVRVQTDAKGEVTLRSLEPGVTCTIAFLDDFGRDLVRRAVRVPPFGEELEVVVRLRGAGPAFTGRVVDADGQPLRGVEVELHTTSGDTHYAHRRTDAGGRFTLEKPGDLSQVQLWLRARGFADQRHDNLTAGGAPALYTLQRGREILVQVVDQADQPLELTPVWKDHRQDGREWLRTGVWRWRDLPPGTVTLHCTVGADEFELVHDTSEPVATLRVPRPAILRLSAANGWPAVADARNALVAVARCLDAEHEVVRIRRPDSGDPETLLPGTWRIDLFEWSQPDRSLPAIERPLGLGTEVTLRAGDDATVILR